MGLEGTCVIGENITIRGNLNGSEDLLVEGRIEGMIVLENHLTVAESGVVAADIEAQDLTINGEMRGDMVASQTVAINASAKVVGNVRAPRVVIEDGARFRGSIDMDVQLPDDIQPRR